MVWISALAALIGISCLLLLVSRRSHGTVAASMSPTALPSVRKMPLEQARSLVDNLIEKGEKLRVEPAGETTPLHAQLGPVTREFFSRYGTLKNRRGSFELSSAGIRTSEYVDGFLSIGHSEDWDVVQRPGEDEVFVVEGAETCDSERETRFPSVYHLVVDEASMA